MGTHSEIKLIIEKYPEYIDRIRELEKNIGSSFFGKDYIPAWACTGRDKGTGTKFTWIDDVVKYLQDNPNQIQMFPKHTGCISVYNICESGK